MSHRPSTINASHRRQAAPRPGPVRGRRAVVALATLVMSGCASFGTMQTADPVGKGKLQLGLEPAVQTVETEYGQPTLARFDFALRYGVSDRLDLGARVGSSGLEAQAKVLLTDPARRRLAVSLAPSAGGFAVESEQARASVNLSLPVLIGLRVGEDSQLILGPKLVDVILIDRGAAAHNLMVGTTLGFAVRVGERVRLVPEVALMYRAAGTPLHDDAGLFFTALGEGPWFQFGLGMLLGP